MNVLGIGAHFDDLELGCSGTLINHVDRGDNVTMVVITNSAYKNGNGELIRGPEIALSEGTDAARLIGAELICFGVETFHVQFNEDVTARLNQLIVDKNIDTIYSHWVHDIHRDHQNAGQCALMAGRHVPRFLMFRSNYYDSTRPFGGNFYSDISTVMDRKIEAIKAHRSELERVRYAWVDFVAHQNRNDGQKIGVEYSEVFEIIRYLA